MLRVLQVVTKMDRGGLETMLMNYYRHIDRETIQFDFLTHRAEEGAYNEEIRALGGKIYTVPRQNPFDPLYRCALHRFFAQHPEYGIVHAHLDCLSGVVLRCAKNHGVPIRIAHAHTSNQLHDAKYPIKLLYKPLILQSATDLLACGEDAGRWMFGKAPFLVLPAAIDTAAYSFHKETREEVRRTLNISKDELLIGHVGQFRKEKNQLFLLRILQAMRISGVPAKLLLIGGGKTMPMVKKQAEKLRLTPYVLFLGVRQDIPALLQAMDVFCMPSLYEGMPLAALEAQAAGLPCVFSDRIPSACVQSPSVRQIPLTAPPTEWANALVSVSQIVNVTPIHNLQAFDINSAARTLTSYYLQKDAQLKRGDAHGLADRIYADV